MNKNMDFQQQAPRVVDLAPKTKGRIRGMHGISGTCHQKPQCVSFPDFTIAIVDLYSLRWDEPSIVSLGP
jgi:hypothetical protein